VKKLTSLFLACLFTNVAVISAYDHPQDGSCKPCESHKEKGCDVCCCIDHISAATEESGFKEIIDLFTVNATAFFGGEITPLLTFQEQLTKSGDSIILVKPNTFLFQCPGQYCVEFAGCVEAAPDENAVADFVIVFLVNGEVLAPVDPRFVFTGTTESGVDRLSCFSKSAVVQVSDCTSSDNPVPFQVVFMVSNISFILGLPWQNIHYSIKITHITDSKCEIAPLNP